MVTALLLSGGTGTRMGVETPKQYIKVKGRPVIFYCLKSLLTHKGIDAVQIVADEAWRDTILQCMDLGEERAEDRRMLDQNAEGESDAVCIENTSKFRGFSAPGMNRQLSILHGLNDIRNYMADSDYVLVHDAARPLVTAAQITDCLEAAAGHGGVLPVLPMKDTVYLSGDGRTVTSLLNRNKIFAGQAPEVFLFGRYYEANRALLPEKILHINGSTEPAVMAGMDIAMIPGDEENFKITTLADLRRFEQIQGDGK